MNIITIFDQFPNQEACIAHLEQTRWKGTPQCPYCNSKKQTPCNESHRHHCNNCNTSYSVTVGTIFHHTHLPLQKWFLAISLILNAKKGLSARQLARDLDVTPNTAWRITMKIREAMTYQGELLTGIVEMDETYVGGKPRKKVRKDDDDTKGGGAKRGRGTKKTAVVGAVERNGNVVAQVMSKESKMDASTLNHFIRGNVAADATLMTDEYRGYSSVKKFMEHMQINHSHEYANGIIHTNTIEGFWALVKRGIIGQYHKVNAQHLSKYLDEFTYRFNNRKTDPAEFFDNTIARALGV